MKSLLKKISLLMLLFASASSFAEVLPDSVVMKVAGKDILVNEFMFIAQKNGEVNLSDMKSLKEYVELFKNFKLKVAQAEELGLDKTKTFKSELDGYRNQLLTSYLSDKDGEDAAVRVLYDRYGEVLELSHILFRLPSKSLSKDTLDVYQKANAVYQQLQSGTDFATLGQSLMEENKGQVGYEYVRSFLPMQAVKAFENVVYSMPAGTISQPIRTTMGFHIVKLHSRKPNPGMLRVAHILIEAQQDSTTQDDNEQAALAQQVYQEAKAGADFAELAKRYSADSVSVKQGGELPLFGVGEMIEPFEVAAFALKTPGDISAPVKTRFGYHIIKLIEKRPLPSFETKKKGWVRQMAQGERNFEFYQAFDERMKQEYGYQFYPEAYAELQKLSDEVFPSDAAFYEKAKDMNKTLFQLNGTDFPQNEFAYYIQRCPFSTKTYAQDFMHEVYDLFIRDIVTTAERNNLKEKHPEFDLLVQEYRDGMLLFEVSNRNVWDKPLDQQAAADANWIRQLNEKYPVEINWGLMKKISKGKVK